MHLSSILTLLYKPSDFFDNGTSASRISGKGGKPSKKREALTDQKVAVLLDTVKGLPPYLFIMLGLYSGLRREEILALQWDCVQEFGFSLPHKKCT